MSKVYLQIICLLFISQACEKGPPIPEDKFMQTYVDFLIVQDTTTKPYNLDSLRLELLVKHNIKPEQYDLMIEYYNENPEKWITFFDTVTVYVDRLKLEAENQP